MDKDPELEGLLWWGNVGIGYHYELKAKYAITISARIIDEAIIRISWREGKW